MDTYIRMIIVLLIHVILEVKGQGGGVAIPWGHGISIDMAEFDPFAHERKPGPDAVIMDPHDPNKPTFAQDSPPAIGSAAQLPVGSVAGGIPTSETKPPIRNFFKEIPGSSFDSKNYLGSPEQWSKESSSSSFSASLSSTKEKSSSVNIHSRPRDSGGVAISISEGSFPGNEPEAVNNSRFGDTIAWNDNVGLDASAFNASLYSSASNALNDSVYSDFDNAFNASIYPYMGNSTYGDMAFFDNNSSANWNNYSNIKDTYNASDASDFFMGMSDVMPEVLNDTGSASDNASGMFNHNTTKNETFIEPVLGSSNASKSGNASEFSNIFFKPEPLQNLQLDTSVFGSHPILSKPNKTYGDSNVITNGGIHSFRAPGIVGPTIVSSFNVPRNVNKINDMNEMTKEIKLAYFDRINEKLGTLDNIQLSTYIKEPATNNNLIEKDSFQNDAVAQSPASIAALGSSLYNDSIKGNMHIDSSISMEQSPRLMYVAVESDFTPIRSSKERKSEQPDIHPKPIKTSSLGMGIPVSFGLSLPGPPDESFPARPVAAGVSGPSPDVVPFGQGPRVEVVSGHEGGSFVKLGIDEAKEMRTSAKQFSTSTSRSSSDMLSTGNIQSPAERRPNVQNTVAREPDLPFSRQPIIETQPAVDFMSTFLSQPLDPTRRGDRQKAVDTNTDISIVPLENQPSDAPSQTLVQDAKSRDWRSFISSFLMGGGPGFEQIGPASFGQVGGSSELSTLGAQIQSNSGGSATSQSQFDVLSRGQVDVQLEGQIDVPAMGSLDGQSLSQMTGSTHNQMSGLSSVQDQNRPEVSQRGGQSVDQTTLDFNPQRLDTTREQVSGLDSRQAESQSLGSLVTFTDISSGQQSGRSQDYVQEPRPVKKEQPSTHGGEIMGDFRSETNNPTSIDKSVSFNPVRDIRDRLSPVRGGQIGMNTPYIVAQNTQNQMQNIIGLSDTRPLDIPQAAEAPSIPNQLSPIDSSKAPLSSQTDLGLSNKPLTSFEGASPSDLQKLKLLEVAQRLLLQERGIKDPQAGSQFQTFTPQGMPGSIENLLTSLNQVNSMAEMLKSSLRQGVSQSTTDQSNTIKPTEAPSKTNVRLGEWSSGSSSGTERQNSVPIGNIFAGRFLQSGTGLPSVGEVSVSPFGGIPVGLPAATVDSSASSLPSTTRGGGFIIKDQLPLSYQRQCNAVRDPTSKYHFYRTVGSGRIRFRCALGTAFDQDTCECSIRVITNGKCLEVDMNFNNGRIEDVSPNELPIGNENVEITNRTTAYPGIAVFSGDAKLTIWRYQNYDFRDHVLLKLRFRPGIGGDRYQPIIANCDGNPEGPSVAVIFDKLTSEVIMILRTDSNNDKNLKFRVDPNRWSDVTYLYDGNSFIGLVNNNRQSMPTQGLVQIRDEALILGHCPRYGYYNGAIDDVKIYTCIPRENRFLL